MKQAASGKYQIQVEKAQTQLDKTQSDFDRMQEKFERSQNEIRKVSHVGFQCIFQHHQSSTTQKSIRIESKNVFLLPISNSILLTYVVLLCTFFSSLDSKAISENKDEVKQELLTCCAVNYCVLELRILIFLLICIDDFEFDIYLSLNVSTSYFVQQNSSFAEFLRCVQSFFSFFATNDNVLFPQTTTINDFCT